jgi:ribosomal protein S27AE
MNEPPRDPPEPAKNAAEVAIRTCPNCGSVLSERKCKLLCERAGCGYYLSCADYY